MSDLSSYGNTSYLHGPRRMPPITSPTAQPTGPTNSVVEETPPPKNGPKTYNSGGWGQTVNADGTTGHNFKSLMGSENMNAMMGMGNALVSSIVGTPKEYDGAKGEITQTMDGAYDTIQEMAGQFGPVGKMVQGIMGANKMLGGIAKGLGAGTDGMTTTDAIMGSAFMQLTPLGLINGIMGKKADTLTRDDAAFEAVGSSYGGTAGAVDEALKKSGKKYGGFSNGSRIQANREIAEAKRQQTLMGEIADDATERFDIRNSMSAINGNRRALAMQGGYDSSSVRVGRQGLSIKNIVAAKRVVSALKYQQGGKVKDPFDIYLQSLPENQRDSSNFRVKDYWEFNGRPKNFDEAVMKGMFTQYEDGWHANSVAENPATGEIEFMKSSSHPSHSKEIDWYNSDDATEFRSQYELQKTDPYWKYVKKKPSGEAVGSYQEGGILELTLADIPEEYLEPAYTIQEITLDSILPEFKEGGKVNVIPEGALHARLHHMKNADNLTKKGIPVVAEKEGGELEQQAEIEREEIIFRLEVTKKLEELLEKYSDYEYSQKEKDAVAIEAGKLLVEEILNNTIDNTNNLL